MNSDAIKTIAIAAAVGVVGLVAWRAMSAGGKAFDAVGGALSSGAQAVSDAVGGAVNYVAPLVNPASSSNLVNQGVTAVGVAATDDPNFTVGGAAYETVNGGEGSFMGNYWAWAGNWWGDVLGTSTPQASYDETERLLKRYPAPQTGGASGSW